MSNNHVPKSNGGLGGVLTTLASSGDKMIQLLIVAGIILNTMWTKSNSHGINENSVELDKLRKQVATEVRFIASNQKIYLDSANGSRSAHEAIMDKLGIGYLRQPPYQSSPPPPEIEH